MTDALAPTAAPPADVLAEYRPIADYGLLADCNSAALVDRVRLDRLALPAALRQPGAVRAAARSRGRALVDPAGGRVRRPSAATCPARS